MENAVTILGMLVFVLFILNFIIFYDINVLEDRIKSKDWTNRYKIGELEDEINILKLSKQDQEVLEKAKKVMEKL